MKRVIVALAALSLLTITGCRFASVDQFNQSNAQPEIDPCRLDGWVVVVPKPITGTDGLYRVGIATTEGIAAGCTADESLTLNEHVSVVRVNVPYDTPWIWKAHHFDWVKRIPPELKTEPQHH